MPLTTAISLTTKQKEALELLDSPTQDKLLLLGGSGSGKTFVLIYKAIRDALRFKAPVLVCRNMFVDLRQGVMDQIVPAILQKIAEANGQERWDKWLIDGLRFTTWSDQHSRLSFCTGGYLRFAGLSKRDISESGLDKLLSPSWLHILVEEVSEVEYPSVEMLITRLRYKAEGCTGKLMMSENPPSMMHWSYRRFYEAKHEDGSPLSHEEKRQQAYLLMNPRDNRENLSDEYIRNLSQLTGANRKRFYEGQFQDSETGEIFKRISWTDRLPMPEEWEKLVIYTDPTPLTGKDYSVYADYKASVLCGLWNHLTFVIDVRLVRGSTLDMLQNVKQLWDISPNQSITEVCMEKKQVPSDFKQVLEQFTYLTGWSCTVKLDTRIFGDKKAAIETFLQPLFENDLILFNSAFRDTERGRLTQYQVLKFSRKANKRIHDDVLDAIMRADTLMKGRKGRKRRSKHTQLVQLVRPGYIFDSRNG